MLNINHHEYLYGRIRFSETKLGDDGRGVCLACRSWQ